MKSLHVKKGDRVQVISGKDKGKVGNIIAVYPDKGRVTVEGVNIVTRHRRDSQGAGGRRIPGGKQQSEAPIDVSNVQLVVKVDGKDVLTRVGYKRVEVTKKRSDGSEYTTTRSVRIARKTGEEI